MKLHHGMPEVLLPLALLGAAASNAIAAPVHPTVLPTPQQVTWGQGEFRLRTAEPVQAESPQDVQDFLTLLGALTHSTHQPGPSSRIRFALLKQRDPKLGDEGYRLQVTPARVQVDANTGAGLFYGSQTLIQLIQANGPDFTIPSGAIIDWPSLPYRGTMVDISRGLVPNVATFSRMIQSLARLKINAVQPYIEDTFAFTAYPYIGRDRGAWTPEEVRQMVAVAHQYHVDLSPCFESLGHMGQILKHPELADLRENGDVITPAKEASYTFLRQCFKELAAAFPFPYINVGCDETGGLGEGPSKVMAQTGGVGKVYSTHLQRLDGLCHEVNRKMQFWGDMMLAYPGIVADMPKDAIVMNWDYSARQHFPNIETYKKYGYQQVVCPGIHSWEGMFPNVTAAEGNIREFVKEGKDAGVLGVLDTAWRDNGEVLFDYDWYPETISAECAWAGAPTSGDALNQAFENAFFGPGGLGLASTFQNLSAAAFPAGSASGFDLYYADPFHNLAPVGSARGRKNLDHLAQLAADTQKSVQAAHPVFHAEVLPFLQLGADRVALIPHKYQTAAQVIDLYNAAFDAAGAAGADKAAVAAQLRKAVSLVADLQKETEGLRDRYAALWLQENKQPGLQRVLDRYDPSLRTYRDLQTRLTKAITDLNAGGALPSPAEMGLQEPSQNATGYRIPTRIPTTPSWAAGSILALTISLAQALPAAMPVQIQVHAADLPKDLPALARLRWVDTQGTVQQTLPCQVDHLQGGESLLTFFMPANSQRDMHFALDNAAGTAADAVQIKPSPELKGGSWISNSRWKALLGPEGAHLYRWDILASGGQDITEPGDDTWHGFDDVGAERGSRFTIQSVLSGPLCVQLLCTAPDGFTKILTFYAGQGWYDTRFDSPVDFFWHYDDAKVMGASSAAPGTYRFADGRTGALPTEGSPSVGGSAYWAAKYRPDGLLLGLVSPDQRTSLRVGPGGSMGGVGVEGGGSTSHLITMADVVPAGWKALADLNSAYSTLQHATIIVGPAGR